jgi:hypothetical protein
VVVRLLGTDYPTLTDRYLGDRQDVRINKTLDEMRNMVISIHAAAKIGQVWKEPRDIWLFLADP